MHCYQVVALLLVLHGELALATNRTTQHFLSHFPNPNNGNQTPEPSMLLDIEINHHITQVEVLLATGGLDSAGFDASIVPLRNSKLFFSGYLPLEALSDPNSKYEVLSLYVGGIEKVGGVKVHGEKLFGRIPDADIPTQLRKNNLNPPTPFDEEKGNLEANANMVEDLAILSVEKFFQQFTVSNANEFGICGMTAEEGVSKYKHFLYDGKLCIHHTLLLIG